MNYRVQFAPEARDQLEDIERFISEAGSPVTAAHYVDATVSFCLRLQTFPERGVPRDDLLPGLRVTHYRQRAVIAYLVEVVSLVGVFYGGQAWEPSFTDSTEHDQ
ncbi:type II toxin-antitoxin system RelE/ParE family toxin [Paraburkholderia sp. RL18-103-BIB-C]|jgi:toxin ParE1/3/4|uniref:type II toxin-antitoxin system RelE/ParE family toxin n=1 Tax=unclassified Paraburkholderia TaxID=2615204 RepID=UPI0038BABC82